MSRYNQELMATHPLSRTPPTAPTQENQQQPQPPRSTARVRKAARPITAAAEIGSVRRRRAPYNAVFVRISTVFVKRNIL